MARLTPQQARDKWVTRIGQATQDIARGVEAVQQAPGAAAAAKFDKWQAGLQAGADKWRRNVGAVPLESWKASMINIGIPRVASGAQAKAGKYEQFAAEFFPYLDQGVAQIARMPDTNLEARIQRSVAMQRHNAAFRRRGGSV